MSSVMIPKSFRICGTSVKLTYVSDLIPPAQPPTFSLSVVITSSPSSFAPILTGSGNGRSSTCTSWNSSEEIERSASGAAASLSGIYWITPLFNRSPAIIFQTLPTTSAIPVSLLPLWNQFAGPVPVKVLPQFTTPIPISVSSL